MWEDAPQPDLSLRILPEFGGQSRQEGRFAAGAPEFVAEVSLARQSYDLNQKLALYQSAGVQEYLAIVLREQEVRWHRRVDGVFQLLPAGEDGVWRSAVFPGLWLHGQALLAIDMPRVLATLSQGLATAEQAAFVDRLARQRRSS